MQAQTIGRERKRAYRDRKGTSINLRHADILKTQERPALLSLKEFGF
jgi:hypothetical protein